MALKSKRKGKVRCSYSSRCTRYPTVKITEDERVCRTHATWMADKLVGDFVKARDEHRCQLFLTFSVKPCWGSEVYWCHLIPKGRYFAVRWEPDNAITACAGHHKGFDESPIEKDDWCKAHLGEERWEELREIGRAGGGPTAADIIRKYREEET